MSLLTSNFFAKILNNVVSWYYFSIPTCVSVVPAILGTARRQNDDQIEKKIDERVTKRLPFRNSDNDNDNLGSSPLTLC